ncbi:MAG: CHAT domain-containing protein, partial [Anaerolineae bacterium]
FLGLEPESSRGADTPPPMPPLTPVTGGGFVAEAMAPDASGAVEPATVTRYTDIACPRRVWVKAPRITVVVRLTVDRPESSQATETLTVRTDLPVQVRVQSEGFEVLNQPMQETPIRPDGDSPPLVFDLRPKREGFTDVALDFFQGGQPLRTVTVPVEITPFEVVEGAEPRPASVVDMARDEKPPEMTLHIAWLQESGDLEFTLIREGGAWWRTFRPTRLNGSPADYTAQLYGRITSLVQYEDPAVESVLQAERHITREDAERRIRKLGENLWDELIPEDLKELYGQERETWQQGTLLLFSDEPHLPWELIWPYGDDWDDDAPWCHTLRLVRWLRKDAQGNGNEGPPYRLRRGSMAVLAPEYSLMKNLSNAQKEKEFLAKLIQDQGWQDVSPSRPKWRLVLDLLEGGGYDWIHAVAHGNFYPQSPDGASALWLQQDEALTPEAIVGRQIMNHLRKARPAFFFNACQVGRQGWALTRMGGWASRLVSGGAGLFVAPLWDVSDDKAVLFAETFYSKLLVEHATLAEATYRARQAARGDGDPTWLAYSVYGHPNARLQTE